MARLVGAGEDKYALGDDDDYGGGGGAGDDAGGNDAAGNDGNAGGNDAVGDGNAGGSDPWTRQSGYDRCIHRISLHVLPLLSLSHQLLHLFKSPSLIVQLV